MKIEQLFSVRGKVALVTGGSRGIGEMIARTAGCTDGETSSWLLETEHKGRYVPDVFAQSCGEAFSPWLPRCGSQVQQM